MTPPAPVHHVLALCVAATLLAATPTLRAQHRFHPCPAGHHDVAPDGSPSCTQQRICDDRGIEVACCLDHEVWNGTECVCASGADRGTTTRCCPRNQQWMPTIPIDHSIPGLCCPRGTQPALAIPSPTAQPASRPAACCPPGMLFDGRGCTAPPTEPPCAPASATPLPEGGWACSDGTAVADGDDADVRIVEVIVSGGLSAEDVQTAVATRLDAIRVAYRRSIAPRVLGLQPMSGIGDYLFQVDIHGAPSHFVEVGAQRSSAGLLLRGVQFPARSPSSRVQVLLRFLRPRGVTARRRNTRVR